MLSSSSALLQKPQERNRVFKIHLSDLSCQPVWECPQGFPGLPWDPAEKERLWDYADWWQTRRFAKNRGAPDLTGAPSAFDSFCGSPHPRAVERTTGNKDRKMCAVSCHHSPRKVTDLFPINLSKSSWDERVGYLSIINNTTDFYSPEASFVKHL